ncbi:MAG: hypothetical protein AB9842_09800 [Bacteroidales bacterium]
MKIVNKVAGNYKMKGIKMYAIYNMVWYGGVPVYRFTGLPAGWQVYQFTNFLGVFAPWRWKKVNR